MVTALEISDRIIARVNSPWRLPHSANGEANAPTSSNCDRHWPVELTSHSEETHDRAQGPFIRPIRNIQPRRRGKFCDQMPGPAGRRTVREGSLSSLRRSGSYAMLF